MIHEIPQTRARTRSEPSANLKIARRDLHFVCIRSSGVTFIREPRPSVVGGKLTHAINHGYRVSLRGRSPPSSGKKPERRVDPSTLMSPRIVLCTRRYLHEPICLLRSEESNTPVALLVLFWSLLTFIFAGMLSDICLEIVRRQRRSFVMKYAGS